MMILLAADPLPTVLPGRLPTGSPVGDAVAFAALMPGPVVVTPGLPMTDRQPPAAPGSAMPMPADPDALVALFAPATSAATAATPAPTLSPTPTRTPALSTDREEGETTIMSAPIDLPATPAPRSDPPPGSAIALMRPGHRFVLHDADASAGAPQTQVVDDDDTIALPDAAPPREDIVLAAAATIVPPIPLACAPAPAIATPMAAAPVEQPLRGDPVAAVRIVGDAVPSAASSAIAIALRLPDPALPTTAAPSDGRVPASPDIGAAPSAPRAPAGSPPAFTVLRAPADGTPARATVAAVPLPGHWAIAPAARMPVAVGAEPIAAGATPIVQPPAATPIDPSEPAPTVAPAPLVAQRIAEPPLPAAPLAAGTLQPTGPAVAPARLAPRSIAEDMRVEAAAPVIPTAPAAAPTTATPVAALDLRRADWPRDMVGHIERLRDAADAVDTRIRLVPDMLGQVDVEVRREGDTLHVRFSAEQPQTRALLQDAQPRLAEAAESRGLKLGQASVDGGTTGQQQPQSQSQRQPAQQQSPAPRAPLSRARTADAPTDDARVA